MILGAQDSRYFRHCFSNFKLYPRLFGDKKYGSFKDPEADVVEETRENNDVMKSLTGLKALFYLMLVVLIANYF